MADSLISIVITNPDGQSVVLDSFTYVPQPIIDSIVPSSGPSSGGTPFTINGHNLKDGCSVEFGAGNPAPGVVVALDGNSLTGITPPAPPASIAPRSSRKVRKVRRSRR